MKKNGCVAKFMHYWPIACLLIIPTVAQAVTVSLVQDVSTANSTYREPGSSVTTGDMASYLDKEGFGNIVSNYVGNVTWGGSFTDWVNQAALKFTLPATSSILSTAKLHLPVTDIQGSAWVTVTLTDDNAWQQTNVSTTSTYPSLVNAKTILSTQSVSTSGDVALSLDTANLRSKITSSGTTTITLILTGNTTTDNYFNFVADDDDASTDQAYLVLTFQPQVQSVSVPSSGTYKAGDALNFTVTFDSTVVVTGTPRIPVTLNTGGTVYASYVSGSNSNNLAFRYTVASGNVDADGVSLGSAISLNSGTIKSNNGDDAELNLYSVAATTSVLVDGVAPTITGVTGPSAGTYALGDTLWFTATFSENVTVSGSPYISLVIGSSTKQAVYASGSGTTTLKFRYVLASGDYDGDGVAAASSVTLNSGTLQDAAGNDATLTFTSPTTTSVLVDGVAPTITGVTGPSAGTYALGDTLWFTATFSENVTVSGSPYISLVIGSSTKQAVYASGSGTTTLKFRYVLAAGDYDADGIATGTGVTLNGGAVQDAAGNDAALTFTAPTTTTVLVDAVAPTISGVTGPSAGTYGIGDDLDFTVATGEDVTVTGSPYIGITVGGVTRTAAYVSGSGTSSLVFRYTLASGDEGTLVSGSSITLDGGAIKDAAGNSLASTSFTAPTVSGVTIDAVAPTISGVTGPSAGTYASGDTLWFTATFSENVTVSGSPYISLVIGSSTKQAVYASGSGTTTLKFRYVLSSGDYDADGIATGTGVTLNGGAVQDAAGNDAALTFTAPTTSAVLVDAVAPTISGVTGPSAGTYGIGDDLDFTVATGEDVTVTGSPYIGITVGGVTRTAAYVSGSGTSSLVFRYTLASGDEGALASGSSITLDGGSIKDAAGNSLASTSFTAPAVSGVTVDAVAPTISGVTGPSAGTYASGDTLWFTATFSENVTVTGSPYIPLTVGSSTKQAVYASGSGTTTLKFRYVLAAGDYDADGIATGTGVTLNGGAVQDAAGNDAVLTFTAPTTTTVLVDAVAPTISGVTGPSAGTYGIGDDLDFTVATGEDVTVTGSPYIGITVGGVTRTAAYVSGSGTSSLVFRYTLASGDEGALASGSSIALNGGAIKDAAGNALASTSFTAPAVSGVTIDAVAPTISGVTGPSAGTYASGDTLWFTATFSENVTVSGSPYISLVIGSSTKQAVYASGSGTTTLKFGYEVTSGDADADGIGVDASISLDEGSIVDAAGNAALLNLGTFETEEIFVSNPWTIMVQKNIAPAGYSLRSGSSSGLFHVELPAGAHHAEIILLDAAGRRLTAKTLDVSSSSMDVHLPLSARWNLAVLRVDGHVKASARGDVPLR